MIMLRKSVFVLLVCLLNSALGKGSKTHYVAALKQRNIQVLEQHLLQISDPTSPSYGAHWSKETILAFVSPLAEDVSQLLVRLARDYGANDLQNYGDAIGFSVVDKLTFSRRQNIKDNEPLVDFVVPRQSLTQKIRRPGLPKRDVTEMADDGFFGREVAERLYNFTADATNASTASIEYQSNQGYSPDDLAYSQSMNGQVSNPVSSDHIRGPNDGTDTESQLDVQLMSEMAEGAALWFWDTPGWLYPFAVDFFGNDTIPNVISMSWGWAEDSQCEISDCGGVNSSQYVARVNAEYVKIGMRGVTIVVSSGDAGAPGRTAEECNSSRPLAPAFPTSSPWVLSVGATFVLAADREKSEFATPLCQQYGCATGSEEVSISYDYVGWTAGGGFELHSPRPKWQAAAVSAYLGSGVPLPADDSFHRSGRAYPDVSAVGHACPTFDGSGEPESVDGTSCSSPVIAGLIAVLNHARALAGKPPLGFVNPLFYKMWADEPRTFQDIVKGKNWCTEEGCCPVRADGGSDYGYKATKGYDPVTGLGTPNVGRMLDYLDRL